MTDSDTVPKADSSRVRETGGYGLGLAIAAAHHGQISAVSRAETGTVFTVQLPME